MRFSAWTKKTATSNNFVKYDIKCILFYSFTLFYQLYVFNNFGRSQSFLVSAHEHFSMNNQNKMMQSVMQEPSRIFYRVLEVLAKNVNIRLYRSH